MTDVSVGPSFELQSARIIVNTNRNHRYILVEVRGIEPLTLTLPPFYFLSAATNSDQIIQSFQLHMAMRITGKVDLLADEFSLHISDWGVNVQKQV
jgi:hypothetical protein